MAKSKNKTSRRRVGRKMIHRKHSDITHIVPSALMIGAVAAPFIGGVEGAQGQSYPSVISQMSAANANGGVLPWISEYGVGAMIGAVRANWKVMAGAVIGAVVAKKVGRKYNVKLSKKVKLL